MIEIPGLQEWLGALDLPLMVSVAVLTSIITRYAGDKYEAFIPYALGMLIAIVAEDATKEFDLRMLARRSFIYGMGGFFFYYLWRDKITGWMAGTVTKVRDHGVKAAVTLDPTGSTTVVEEKK